MVLADDLVDDIEDALKTALGELQKIRFFDEHRQALRRKLERAIEGIQSRREELEG